MRPSRDQMLIRRISPESVSCSSWASIDGSAGAPRSRLVSCRPGSTYPRTIASTLWTADSVALRRYSSATLFETTIAMPMMTATAGATTTVRRPGRGRPPTTDRMVAGRVRCGDIRWTGPYRGSVRSRHDRFVRDRARSTAGSGGRAAADDHHDEAQVGEIEHAADEQVAAVKPAPTHHRQEDGRR